MNDERTRVEKLKTAPNTCACLICSRPDAIDSDAQCAAWFDAVLETWNESDMECSFLFDELEEAMLTLAAHGDVAAASRAHKALRIVREWRRTS
jgi:hypothetical protein